MPATAQNRSKNQLLPLPSDLPRAASQAASAGQPLVLMVSLPGCPWCELLRRNYFSAMRGGGLPVFEFMVNDRQTRLQDFQGQRSTPEALSRLLKIHIAPTILFFNTQGQEIAPRIEGVASADFIGAVIDERLDTARLRLKKP
ncbi:MAG: thioredoxin fold domain-containing protein [Brachymonas sp.]|nr:thioredoxin fold domain-containing protein [Brachymonas sp.]